MNWQFIAGGRALLATYRMHWKLLKLYPYKIMVQ